MNPPTVAIVGAGRLGTALVRSLPAAFTGPFGRGFDGTDHDAVLLCVPDGEIAAAAAALAPTWNGLIGHCSGATGLSVLGDRAAFSLHPLMTVTAEGATLAGAAAAVDASSSRALQLAVDLALALEMTPIRIRPEDRAAYHAAASIASNFLVTLETAAERIAETAGVEREMLAPLVRATVENWVRLGGERALTGPVTRGDQATVEHQRDAIASRTPEILGLFDALVDATRTLADDSTRTVR